MKGRETGKRGNKGPDFPFMFYIVTFGDSYWQEKKARLLGARFQFHLDFTKV